MDWRAAMMAVRPCADVVADPAGFAAVARFEEEFTYPLGARERFRVAYGGAMREFFRAQGEAEAWAAMSGGRCFGLLGASVREVRAPGGAPRRLALLGGLKVRRSMAGALAFGALACTAQVWLKERGADAAFGVVMDGTGRTPDQYSGRLWLPAFRPGGALRMLRFWRGDAPWHEAAAATRQRWAAPLPPDCWLRLPSEDPARRSLGTPRWICDSAGAVRLEDTRRAKRLFRAGAEGGELRAAHLGALTATDAAGAVRVIGRGLCAAWAAAAECAFLSLPEGWWPALAPGLARLRPEVFGARLYAAGGDLPPLWADTWDI